MRLKTRRLMWAGFVLIFLSVMPGIMAYASGWRFDLSKKWFVRTSTLIVATYPERAKVEIEGLRATYEPGWIKFLPSGKRHIKVQGKKGGRWDKILELTPGKVTFAEHVILFSPQEKVYIASLPGTNPRRTMARVRDLSEGGGRLTSRERKQPGGGLILRQASPYELLIFDPQTNQEELLQRRSKPIIRAEWFPTLSGLPEKSGWVIFADKNEVMALEIDNRDQRNIVQLTATERIDDFAITADGRELLVAGRLSSREGIFSVPLFYNSTTE